MVFIFTEDSWPYGFSGYFDESGGVVLVPEEGKEGRLYFLRAESKLVTIGNVAKSIAVDGKLGDFSALALGEFKLRDGVLPVRFADGLVIRYRVVRSFDVGSLLVCCDAGCRGERLDAFVWLVKVLGVGDVEHGCRVLEDVYGKCSFLYRSEKLCGKKR